MISPQRVETLLKNALSPDGVPIEGFIHTFCLVPAKIDRAEVIKMLEQLQVEFFDNGGGGWSALNLCMTAQGDLWTGEQRVTELLYCLAAALDLASFLLPRDIWKVLPGGMPYVVFNRSAF